MAKSTNTNTIIIKGGQVVLPSSVNLVDILIENGVITKIDENISVTDDHTTIEAVGKYVLPGFIDIHNHGARGFDFSFGNYDLVKDQFTHEPESFKSGLRDALRFYLSKGVTSVYLTSMAAPLEILLDSFSNLNSFLGEQPEFSNLIGGINLEGTFLKDPAYAGAQNPKFFYELDANIINRLQEASGRLLKIINIPPEHGSTAIKLIGDFTSQNIVIAAGHTAAYGDDLRNAVEAGLRLGVHFLNGPARSSSKSFHQGGAEEMMLKSDEVYLEIIADGYHVDPSYVRDIIARKGPDKVIAITDSMFANGLQNLSKFTLFGLHGAVSENRQYLQMLDSEDTLFGSVLSSNVAFANMVSWLTQEISGVWHRHHPALNIDDALMAASKMCSANPARLLGTFNPKEALGTGSLEVGKWGDVAIGTLDINQRTFDICNTILNGQVKV